MGLTDRAYVLCATRKIRGSDSSELHLAIIYGIGRKTPLVEFLQIPYVAIAAHALLKRLPPLQGDDASGVLREAFGLGG